METARDTIKYITPVYSAPAKNGAKGGNMKGTHHGFDNSIDPYNMVDTDESFDMAEDFSIKSLPTLIVIENDKEVKRAVGNTAWAEIQK